MAFRETFGRFLLVIICIMSPISMFKDPSGRASSLSESYSKLFAKIKEQGFVLPLAPKVLASRSVDLIYLTATLLLLGSILTIANKRIGSYLLILLLTSFCLVIHNPFLYPKEKDYLFHTQAFLLNAALISGLLLIGDSKPQAKKKSD
jgi:HR-like lesion-inducing